MDFTENKKMASLFLLLVIAILFSLVVMSRRSRLIGPEVQTSIANTKEQPKRNIWVNATGTLLDRLRIYNNVLADTSNMIQKLGLPEYWCNVQKTNMIYKGFNKNFLEETTKYPGVTTVYLKWAQRIPNRTAAESNFLISEYYDWAARGRVCAMISGEIPTRSLAYYAVYNKTCHSDIDRIFHTVELEPILFHIRPIVKDKWWPPGGVVPPDLFRNYPAYVHYVQIIENALIAPTGEVFSRNIKIAPHGCYPNVQPYPIIGRGDFPIYHEVFVACQNWGTGFFHGMLESFPRLAPFVQFLKENMNVKIKLPAKGSFFQPLLEALGIEPNRIVTGWVRANLTYLPRATYCGLPMPLEVQLLSHHYREYIKQNLNPSQRNILILIQRTRSRRFAEHKAIEITLKKLAADNDLEYFLFTDRPLPPMHTTMERFYGALLIVAPHGAGLSNMIFSRPGTFIVEGLCQPPLSNLCYQRTATVLGHHYVGLTASSGCESTVKVSATEIHDTVSSILEKKSL